MPHFARIAAASSHAKPPIIMFSRTRPYGSATIIICPALAIYHIFCAGLKKLARNEHWRGKAGCCDDAVLYDKFAKAGSGRSLLVMILQPVRCLWKLTFAISRHTSQSTDFAFPIRANEAEVTRVSR
jgi:hypothetical protein